MVEERATGSGICIYNASFFFFAWDSFGTDYRITYSRVIRATYTYVI